MQWLMVPQWWLVGRLLWQVLPWLWLAPLWLPPVLQAAHITFACSTAQATDSRLLVSCLKGSVAHSHGL